MEHRAVQAVVRVDINGFPLLPASGVEDVDRPVLDGAETKRPFRSFVKGASKE